MSDLFGKNIPPACKYCEKTLRVINHNTQVLCEKYGVVMADHSCRHFAYDPLWRVPQRPNPLSNSNKQQK